MDTSLEFHFEQSYEVLLTDDTGVNDDGMNRQDIIADLKPGEPLYFQREINHPDPFAINVYTENRLMVGQITREKKLARHLDRGGVITGNVKRISGGPNLVQKTLKLKGKKYNCFVEVVPQEIEIKKFRDFIKRDEQIAKAITRAESHQKDNIRLAVKNYRQAIDLIIANDEISNAARAWRRTKVPVNVLSMIYEQSGKYSEAADLIDWYFGFDDYCGISKYDLEMITIRRKRLADKIKK